MKTLIPKLAAAIIMILHLAACSNYDGPVTNAPSESNVSGPPLLTGGFAP